MKIVNVINWYNYDERAQGQAVRLTLDSEAIWLAYEDMPWLRESWSATRTPTSFRAMISGSSPLRAETPDSFTEPQTLISEIMKLISADAILDTLLSLQPRPTAAAPKTTRGIYGLVDHLGHLRYIGSTSSREQTFYERIHQRHRTGSEGMSHYFSFIYNIGRMWRARKDEGTAADGKLAKALRNAFVAQHCAAVWVELPDNCDIPRIEREILSLAPPSATMWNGRKATPYEEPVELVDATMKLLGWGQREREAVERQRQRFLGVSIRATSPTPAVRIAELPAGPFRFVALDVETANNNCGSICQIGLAGVKADNSIQTWKTYVNPRTDDWSCSWVHGITVREVAGAPTFAEVLPMLAGLLQDSIVYQHSNFDSTAIVAASLRSGLRTPKWNWKDSVELARRAWPELKGNSGYGLASLKQHLDLQFTHHDAGEDARACAEVVLRAEEKLTLRPQAVSAIASPGVNRELAKPNVAEAVRIDLEGDGKCGRLLGITEVRDANIRNNHIYLRPFFEKFPADAIGGSNTASAARREVTLHWGASTPVTTDLDGQKKFFRKRGWLREFFDRNGVRPGDQIAIIEIEPYQYRVEVRFRK